MKTRVTGTNCYPLLAELCTLYICLHIFKYMSECLCVPGVNSVPVTVAVRAFLIGLDAEVPFP